jgi:hypothetical protein
MSKRRAYHSARLLQPLGPCPTPWKRGYHLEASALEAMRLARTDVLRTNVAGERRVYSCPCGMWHVTSHQEPTVSVPEGGPLPAGLIPAVMA